MIAVAPIQGISPCPLIPGRRPAKNPVAEVLDLPNAPMVTTRAARGTGIAFLELNCERRNAGITKPVREDAFLIALQLKKAGDFDLYADGRLIQPEGYDSGEVAIFDLRMNLATDLRDPFHAVNLYVPHQRALRPARGKGKAFSSAAPQRKSNASEKRGPTSCAPIGNPDLLSPQGKTSAGWCERLNG